VIKELMLLYPAGVKLLKGVNGLDPTEN